MRRAAYLLLILSLTLVGPAVGPGAEPATATPSATSRPSAPPAGVVFNDPTGGRARQQALVTQLNRGIDATPRGATITMAQYLYTLSNTTESLVRAHARGVRVQVLVDGRASSAALTRLRKALGTNRSKPSFVTACRGSCMSGPTSVMHAKFFLFSQTGGQRNTTMISSANPDDKSAVNSWNNLHTIHGNRALYNSLRRYFTDMLPDRNRTGYYRTTSSGPYQLHLYPRSVRRSSDILPLHVLRNVSCTKVAKGYGRKGRTQIRIAMFGWTAARANVARQVWKLHDRGCHVEVITNRAKLGPKVERILLKRSAKRGQLRVYDAWVDRNRDRLGERYLHHKVLMINGRWFGKRNVKVVYTGSQNFTDPGTTRNNDLVLRIRSNAIHDAYGRHLDGVRKHTKRLR